MQYFNGYLLPHPHKSKIKPNSKEFWKRNMELIHKQNVFLQAINKLLVSRLETFTNLSLTQRFYFLVSPMRAVHKYKLLFTIGDVKPLFTQSIIDNDTE